MSFNLISGPAFYPVFEDDIEPVRTFVVDACLVSHLHEIALCLTQLYDIPDTRIWTVIGEELELVFKSTSTQSRGGFWHKEREHFLTTLVYPLINEHAFTAIY